MRIITWNCRIGGFRKKAKQIAPLKPDVLAVQEVEPIDNVLLFDGECQPTYRDRANCPAYPRRSIGVFSYTNTTKLRAVDVPDPENLWTYAFRRYEAHREGQTFNVAAVWPYATKARKNSYRQAHQGLTEHHEWIQQRPTVVIGDFNQSAKFKGDGWSKLQALTDSLGLVSAYHHFFGESFGNETRPTHFHHGKMTSAFHLDYCFLPGAWAPHITKVEVGDYDAWSKFSDHAPLIVDLDLPAMA